MREAADSLIYCCDPVDTGGDGIRDNVERLVAELNDQAAAIQMLQADGVFDGPIYSGSMDFTQPTEK